MPEGSDVVLTTKADGVAWGATTDIVKAMLAVCAVELESTTVTLKEELPGVVGVPEMIPVLAARLSPAGSCPLETLHV